MNEHDQSEGEGSNGGLGAAVRRKRAQVELGRSEGERSIAQNLALIGALGWTVVAPLVLGIFLGRWLDGRLGSGYLWTLLLLFGGLALGSVLAWNRMHRE